MIAEDYPFERRTNSQRRAAFFAVSALLAAQVCLAADAARVTAVRFWSLGDVTRVAIEVSSEFSYKSDRLTNPERLFFDIHGASPAMVRRGVHTIAVGDGLVTQIRVAETTPGITRVVMDLAQPAASVTSQLSNPDRLVVEVRSKDKPAPPQSPSVTGGSRLSGPPEVSEQENASSKAPVAAPGQISKTDTSATAVVPKTEMAVAGIPKPPAKTTVETTRDAAPPAARPVPALASGPLFGTSSVSATVSNTTAASTTALSTTASSISSAGTSAGTSGVRPEAAASPKLAGTELARTEHASQTGKKATARKAAQVPLGEVSPAPVERAKTETVAAAEHAATSGAIPPIRSAAENAALVEPSASSASLDVAAPRSTKASALPSDGGQASSAPRETGVPEMTAPEVVVRDEKAPRELMAKVIPPPKIVLPKETGPAPLPAKRGSRTLTRALGLKLGRVVLDAGHGGYDVGTHGPSGYLEKDLALDVTQRLGALIEEDMGSEVIYTRPTDTFVGLEERTKIANERKADLFLSIHANSSSYRSVAGAETYVLSFTTSKTALDIAARENASSQSSIFDLQELLGKIALKDKVDESREFAVRLQTALSVLSANSNEAAKNRGVKRAPFVVLIGANMPSVLAEIGFLTNANDEALLRKPEHRQKIAEALYKGIASYAATLSHFQVAKN